jgi:hypothetical protein
LIRRLVRACNPLVAALLRSPLHGLVSGRILVLGFTGRKSGRAIETPVSYIEDVGLVRVFTTNPWWCNVAAKPDVTLWFRGKRASGRAKVISNDPEAVLPWLGEFLRRIPRDARFYDVRIGARGRPEEGDLARAAARTTMMEIRIAGPGGRTAA